MKIKTKLITLILLVVFIPISIITLVIYMNYKSSLEEQMFNRLERIADSRAMNLKCVLFLRKEQLKELSGSVVLKKMNSNGENDTVIQKNIQKNIEYVFNTMAMGDTNLPKAIQEINISDCNGKIVANSDVKNIGKNISHEILKRVKENGTVVTGYDYDSISDKRVVIFAEAIYNIEDSLFCGITIFKIEPNILFEITKQLKGLGETGEIIVCQKNDNLIEIINTTRHPKKMKSVIEGDSLCQPLQYAVNGSIGRGYSIDYRGEEVMSYWRNIPGIDWGLVIEIDKNEAFEPLYKLLSTIFIFGMFFIVLITFVTVKISSSIAYPITLATEKAKLISIGDLSFSENITGDVEINRLNNALTEIQKINTHITEISTLASKGDYSKRVIVNDARNTLAISINTMMETTMNLLWKERGVGLMLEEISVQYKLKDITEKLLNQIIPYIQANVGAIYIIQDNKSTMEFMAGYCYKPIHNTIDLKNESGLIGQAIKEKKAIIVNNSNNKDLIIKSEFCEIVPTSIIAMPILMNNELKAVIEIGSLNEFSTIQLDFLSTIKEHIAIAIHIAQNRNKIQELLEESQAQNEELQSSEEELMSQQNELERIRMELEQQISCLNEATIVAITNVKGEIIHVNDMFCKTSKYSKSELIGNNHRLLKSGLQTDDMYSSMWQTLINKRMWKGELCNRAKDGSYYWLETTIIPFTEHSGQIDKYIGVSFDITSQYKQKQELKQKAIDLEQISRYKSEFLANMSHELRTPLNSILLLSKLMSENVDKNLSDKHIEFANVIYNSGNGLLELISDILDLSKIESGKISTHIEEIKINDVIKNLSELFSSLASSKDISLNFNLQDASIKTIITDRIRLEQVLKNLLSNAIKFTENGSVELTIYYPENTVHYFNPSLVPGKVIAFRVKDTGIGIAAEKQHIVFEPFQQADGSTHRKYGGTGLGLSISKKIAGMLGGELTLESEEGKGSEFTLYMPINGEAAILAINEILNNPNPTNTNTNNNIVELINSNLKTIQSNANLLKDENNVNSNKVNNILNNKKVLIVDDDYRNIYSVTKLMEIHNMIVTSASNGIKAIELLNNQSDIDIILMDIMMPEMDGYETIQEIRKMEQWKDIPIVILTAKAMLGDKEKSIDVGANEYISKPIDTFKLIDIMSNLLNK
jgi:PAS domain S-box-containing protein